MDSSEDEELQEFIKNLTKPISNADAFLKEHGIKWDLEKPSTSKADHSPQTEVEDNTSFDEYFERKLSDFQKCLFGEDDLKDINEPKNEHLENIMETVKKQMNEEDVRPKIRNLRDLKPEITTYGLNKAEYLSAKEAEDFVSKYNDIEDFPLKYEAESEEIAQEQLRGLMFLCKNFKPFAPGPSGTWDLPKSPKPESKEENERKIPTTEKTAEILAACADSNVISTKDSSSAPVTSKHSENASEITAEKSQENENESDVDGRRSAEVEDQASKKQNEKDKKENKYEPKQVDVVWSDVRTDKEFAKELSEIMNCDAINYNGERRTREPELDDMYPEPACLPRDLLKMLTSASDNDFEDWEYSIKLQQGVEEECEDTEFEDLLKKEKAEILNRKELVEEKQEDLSGLSTDVSLDTSLFLQEIMPINVDEIVGERNTSGEIIGFRSLPKAEEHLLKEYMWLYEKLDSDSEEEEEEEEDDPEEKMGETGWETDEVKETKKTEVEEEEISEEALLTTLNSIEEFTKRMDREEGEQCRPLIPPRLQEQINLGNKLLDKLNVPRAGEVEEGTHEDVFKKELKKLEHIRQAHLNEPCPPGKLEGVISDEEEEDPFIKEFRGTKNSVEEFETISRPAKLLFKFPVEDENSTQDLPKVEKTSKSQQPLFHNDEYLVGGEDHECEELHNIFDDSSSSSSYQSGSSSTDESLESAEESSEEDYYDDEFRKEYFRRGGTEKGLGEHVLFSEERDNLKSYSEKFFTFPFASQHCEFDNFVRMRRVLAQGFPEFREEAFADLSKDISAHLSEPDNSSSDSDQNMVFVPEPFESEDVLQKSVALQSSYDDEVNLTSAGEDGESDFEPIVPASRTYEDLASETELANKKRHKKRRKKPTQSQVGESSDDSENEGTPRDQQTICGMWSPHHKIEQPTGQSIVDTMKIVHKVVVPSKSFVTKIDHKIGEPPPNFKPPKGFEPVKNIILPPPNLVTLNDKRKVLLPPPKFRTPKGMKEWLRGEFTPSKETLQKWKTQFLNFYGDNSMLDRVISSEQQLEYESFLETLEEELGGFEEAEVNLLKEYKKLLEEKKKAKEEKEKADEIIMSGDAPAEEESSSGVDKDVGNDLVDGAGPVNSEECKVEKNQEVHRDTSLTSDDVLQTQSLDSYQEKVPTPIETFRPVIKLRETPAILKKEEWAEEVDCSLKIELDFTPAMTFSFELDGFQRQAIAALESGLNVFVSAHTSAGKTVVAEYAIAMSKRNRSKAVYTSPVKALSNQKYADFKRIFGSVGLITGDIQLNENAECLIMTTEILRSMLYNSSEKIRDLQFVVFDEVHYINDPERGHVWEEVLILLSSQVQIVMLSATVPNTLEFANWVGRTKQRKVIVCATHDRPVPLNHYLYTGTGGPSPGNTYLLKSGNGQFLLKNYLEAEGVMKAAQERERQNKKKQLMKKAEEEREWKKKGQQGPAPTSYAEDAAQMSFKKDQTMWISLISFLEKKDWLPAVSFVFSRKKCDSFAEMLYTVDLTTKSEKSFIHKFIKSQIEKLDEVDQDLPQIQIMKRQLDKGIGVHHSGILPVMKEIVEVLFQEGKVKLLFATETFAMGVNMPARTVVFHSITKFDGNDTRLLLPAEYVQMAGRAGRRGKDAAGNVIILAKPNYIIPRNSLEILLFGNPCKLISKFRLTYRMILNTLTVSGMLTVQNMMERSYCENQGQLKRMFLQKDLIEAEEKEKRLKKSMSAKVTEIDVEVLSKFYDDAKSYIEKWNYFRAHFIANSKVLRDINAGRLLKICMGPYINRTTLLLEADVSSDDPSRNVYKVLILNQNNEFERSIAPDGQDMDQNELELWYRIVSLMKGLPSELEIVSGFNDYTILSVKCYNIVAVYKETAKLHRNHLDEFITHLNRKGPGFRNKTCDAGDNIARLLYSYTGRATEIDERLSVNENFELAISASEVWSLYDAVEESAISCKSPLVMGAFRRVFRWKQALSKVEDLKLSMSIENMSLYPDFVSKLSLLKDKGYISSSEQVLMKGFMAARIGKYELIVCELLVENVLVDLSPEEAAALLSFLVYQTSSDDVPLDKTLPPSLQAAIEKCKKIMVEVTNLEKSYDIRDFEGSEISKLKFGLVPVMYAWAKQEPLKNIMEMPVDFDFQEGMLVRWIQQLLETLKEVEAAARLMGDPGVPSKLQAAGTSIKRGIVFAPSLYTTML